MYAHVYPTYPIGIIVSKNLVVRGLTHPGFHTTLSRITTVFLGDTISQYQKRLYLRTQVSDCKTYLSRTRLKPNSDFLRISIKCVRWNSRWTRNVYRWLAIRTDGKHGSRPSNTVEDTLKSDERPFSLPFLAPFLYRHVASTGHEAFSIK